MTGLVEMALAAIATPRRLAALALTVAALVAVIWLWRSGYAAGEEKWTGRLKDDRIEILTDGKEIDDAVDGDDDAGLCAILGGC